MGIQREDESDHQSAILLDLSPHDSSCGITSTIDSLDSGLQPGDGFFDATHNTCVCFAEVTEDGARLEFEVGSCQGGPLPGCDQLQYLRSDQLGPAFATPDPIPPVFFCPLQPSNYCEHDAEARSKVSFKELRGEQLRMRWRYRGAPIGIEELVEKTESPLGMHHLCVLFGWLFTDRRSRLLHNPYVAKGIDLVGKPPTIESGTVTIVMWALIYVVSKFARTVLESRFKLISIPRICLMPGARSHGSNW